MKVTISKQTAMVPCLWESEARNLVAKDILWREAKEKYLLNQQIQPKCDAE